MSFAKEGNTIKWLRASALAIVLLVPLAGCVAQAHVGASAVLVATPPPQPVASSPPACPAAHVLAPGRYHWSGMAWVWVEPACLYKPGYVWVSPTYVIVSGGVRYSAGYWKPAPVHPGPVKKKGALPVH